MLKGGPGGGARAGRRAGRRAQRLRAGLGRSAVLRRGRAAGRPAGRRARRGAAPAELRAVGLRPGRAAAGTTPTSCRCTAARARASSPACARRQGGAVHRRREQPARARRRTCWSTARPALRAWVCENLGGPGERVRRFTLAELAACADVGPLNVLLLVRDDPAWRPPPAIPFLHEDAFAKRMPKKGLITKREVRLLSLAALGIAARQRGLGHRRRLGLGGDRGGPAGPARAASTPSRSTPKASRSAGTTLRTHARRQRARGRGPRARGAGRPGGPRRRVRGRQPRAAWRRSSTSRWPRLRPGGRLVVNAITLENAAEAYQAFRKHELVPEVTLLQVSRARAAGALPALRGAQPHPDLRRRRKEAAP